MEDIWREEYGGTWRLTGCAGHSQRGSQVPGEGMVLETQWEQSGGVGGMETIWWV